MDKRSFLRSAAAMLAAASLPLPALAAGSKPTRLLAGWRSGASLPAPLAGEAGDYVGVLAIDWTAAAIRLESAIPVASRGHGLMGLPGGQGYLALAYRHGLWVMRADADGKQVRLLDLATESGRVSGGHIELAADARHFFTTEIDQKTGLGWVSVRRVDTLAKVAEWPTHGMDPHQLTQDAQGMLLIANGGIRYTDKGSKRDLDQMASSLVRINPANGELLGQWSLRDQRLSLRHLAWNETPKGEVLLGIAMQGEHETSEARKNAPTLAVWNGKELSIPTQSPLGEGYTGDIMAGPGGGFILSAQLSGKVLLWHPGEAAKLSLIGEFHRAGALSGPDEDGGFLIAGEKGPVRWHLRDKSQMLAWPIPMSPDNHWALLEA
ncbi:DUF1513 domain-containing protein [Uliginosibacterium sp. 31-16]|uniref:DUF1513 domain-containing protein n=1 Tax=Uliginosibacterium sp. 31-16 TaxID=3068315 RepID=UPI00273E023F|nr:DUF1513 domain-containing protein [Uliginosibacterium sp. 31-16]MDP5238350.1 DUF1513 domain-containing protein [Uliginosibacterium sp. 31-16]